MDNTGLEIRIKGKVQGVGFRPFVWQLAHKYQLCGDVNNDGQGVLVRVLAEHLPLSETMQAFLQDLKQKLPLLAQITALEIREVGDIELPQANSFIIRESVNNQMDTQIIPDAATCPDCIVELFDRKNRRYSYPFINCTHCGPRFTIINAMPYDRKHTSMSHFPLCPECEQEYRNPADRRFHAQPNACSVCGPTLMFYDQNQCLAQENSALSGAIQALKQGKIIAIKGLGGFHLACDATQENAVKTLRERKQRPSKPFAVMVPHLGWLAQLNKEEIEHLESTAAPIVLLAKEKTKYICDLVAPKLNEIGIMLPSNPLQHLLLKNLDRPLVMTSANLSGLPPVTDNQQALIQLAPLADYWLCHNRDILQRADDSLVRVADGLETLRRARGYVPNEIELKLSNQKNILALGADLKNTFCLLRGNKAIVSQHLGDMQNEQIQQQFINNIALFEKLYQFTPDIVAIDAHSGYFSHQFGKKLAQTYQIPCVETLHHHAHIISVLAEHQRLDEKVIGLALDGIGMGANQQLWGGECLLVQQQKIRHLGGLPPVALAGGDLAAKQPWRNLLAHCLAFVPDWQNSTVAEQFAQHSWQPLAKAIEHNLNSPLISSAGRLFDAVACALGITSTNQSWEGEAASQLEALAWQYKPTDNAITQLIIPVNSQNHLDLAYFWQHWLALDLPKSEKAWLFHAALAQGLAGLVRKQAQKHQVKTLVLAGGVWHNRLLRTLIKQILTDFEILTAHRYPMGDGGISLGQAVLAAYV